MECSKLTFLSLITLVTVNFSTAGPVPGGNALKIDQRQEGEWNVRADLQNFVILIVPTNLSTGLASFGLLDLLRKAPNTTNKNHNKNKKSTHKKTVKKQQQQQEEEDQQQSVENDEVETLNPQIGEETQHFIESKTAPYHVDISKSRSNLAKLYPQQNLEDGNNSDGLLIAHSPSISILKNVETGSNQLKRVPKAYVISIPVASTKNSKLGKNKVGTNKEISDSGNWHLLGDGIEDCGPGMSRDSKGVCRTARP